MTNRTSWAACGFSIILMAPCQADIYRWDNGQVIPGTKGIEPGPGVRLENRNLEYAVLGFNLSNAQLDYSNLTGASFGPFANLAGADFTGTHVAEANFLDAGMTLSQLTREQLYSTASYKEKDLHGIVLGGASTGNYGIADLTSWDFSGQNLTGAHLGDAKLANANFTGAVVTGANFGGTTFVDENGIYQRFTPEQLYSTANYQDKNLTGIGLGGIDLTGWDFRGQRAPITAILDGPVRLASGLNGDSLCGGLDGSCA